MKRALKELWRLNNIFLIFRWGCEHKQKVRETYEAYTAQQHQELSALWCRSPHWFLPSLPWSISRCLAVLLLLWRWYFGNQVPTLCQRHRSHQCHWKETEKKHFCIENTDVHMHLTHRDHQYHHYQVPAQLFVTRRKFCGFRVWSTSNFFVQKSIADSRIGGVVGRCSKHEVNYRVWSRPTLFVKCLELLLWFDTINKIELNYLVKFASA